MNDTAALAKPTKPFVVTITPTPYSSTLSLHDALPIFKGSVYRRCPVCEVAMSAPPGPALFQWDSVGGSDKAARRLEKLDRKSTRLNSSHVRSSYAVFCLKKKNAESPESVEQKPKIAG